MNPITTRGGSSHLARTAAGAFGRPGAPMSTRTAADVLRKAKSDDKSDDKKKKDERDEEMTEAEKDDAQTKEGLAGMFGKVFGDSEGQ